jgi:hypothetical protein
MPTIEFQTYNKRSYEHFRPVKADTYRPDWWKYEKVVTASHDKLGASIRACPGMDDFLAIGWYILAVRDIHVKRIDGVDGKNWTVSIPDGKFWENDGHPATQIEVLNPVKGDVEHRAKTAIKITLPWNIVTPKDYYCMYLDPFLFNNTFIQTWQGVIDTDKFNENQENAIVILYPKVEEDFIIKEGTPLVQVIPMKREYWTVSCELLDWKSNKQTRFDLAREEYYSEHQNKKDNNQASGVYRKLKWENKKDLYDEIPKECPFHKGEEDAS